MGKQHPRIHTYNENVQWVESLKQMGYVYGCYVDDVYNDPKTLHGKGVTTKNHNGRGVCWREEIRP